MHSSKNKFTAVIVIWKAINSHQNQNVTCSNKNAKNIIYYNILFS